MPRAKFLSALAATAVTPLYAVGATGTMPSPARIADLVRAEFLHAWNGYKRFAWGHDEVRPVTGTTHDFFIEGHSLGLSIIEAMDTLYVMGLDDELQGCVAWLRANMNFDVDGDVQMFEAVIRMVAGLTTGYHATGERFLLDGARDLADRLLPCFTKSPTGAPYRYANLRTGAVRDPLSNLAEIGTNILEFGELSRLTGDPKYLAASKKAYRAVMAHTSTIGLLGTYFDVEKGVFTETVDVAPDEPVDSFYEYLWGGRQMLGDADCREWYARLTPPILKYKAVRVNGLLWFQPVDYLTGMPTGDHTQSELAAFYAELVAKGGNRTVGAAYYDSYTAVANKYGLIPESFDYTTLTADPADPGYQLRPEYANAAFDLWFLTRDQKYRETAYAHFLQMQKNCRVANGYTILKDVRTAPMIQGDLFPAYAFSENFKYLYLMFADSPRFNGAGYYLNTEGKILRGLKQNPKLAGQAPLVGAG
ncbi:MAG TPA: glycoside hydrolase family 47 protein [Candidatus Baltobacteraceae bacterium]